MDEEDELRKFKLILGAFCAFLISGYFAYQECKFLVWGATAEATITNMFETTGTGRNRRSLRLAIEYTFTDSATGSRSERDDVPISWPIPQGTVTVQYLPGVAKSSRLLGNSSTFFVWIFCGCIALLGYAGYRLYKEANEPVRPKRRK